MADANATISTRRIAAQNSMTHSVAWRILKEQQLHQFHYKQTQDILLQEWPLRIQFCQLLLDRQVQDLRFSSNIIFSDEVSPQEVRFFTYISTFFKNKLVNDLLGYHIIPGNLIGIFVYQTV